MVVYASSDRVLGLLSATMGDFEQSMVHFDNALAFCRRAGYQPEYVELLRLRRGLTVTR